MAAPSSSKRKRHDHHGGWKEAAKKTKGGSGAGGAAAGGSSSSSGKRAIKHERQSHRKHADVVAEAKSIWNELRLKSNTGEKNRELMDRLVPLIRGRANEIALQHDASRVIQAAIKHGTPVERREILRDLCAAGPGNLAELSKSQYARFCVLRAIQYCRDDDDCVGMMIKSLRGRVAKMAVHAVASHVVESLFATLSPKQTAALRQEFYGPHFALFASDAAAPTGGDDKQRRQRQHRTPTLASNLERLPEKKDATMGFVKNLVQKGMEKALYGFQFFQELLAEYCDLCPPNELRAVAGTASDNVIHLLSTRPGTRAACYLISYATAKDRKRIMRSLKGYARSGLLHRDAYLAILRLVEVTDDTKSIHKNVLNELLLSRAEPAAAAKGGQSNDNDETKGGESPLLEIALSDTGSKLFSAIILIDDDDARNKIFDPYERSVLFPRPVVTEGGEEVPTSRKDPRLRRRELRRHVKDELVVMCRDHAEQLLRSLPGSMVLREVYGAFRPPNLIRAVVDVCDEALKAQSSSESPPSKEKNGDDDDDGENGEDGVVPLFEDRCGHLAIKNLILVDSSSSAAPSSDDDDDDKHDENNGDSFASAFFERFQDSLMDIARSNRGAFVVGALCQVPALRESVSAKTNKAKLKKLSSSAGGATAGYKALLNELNKK